MTVPVGGRLASLFFPVVPLIDSGDAGPETPGMVEDGFGNFETYTRLLEIGRQRSSPVSGQGPEVVISKRTIGPVGVTFAAKPLRSVSQINWLDEPTASASIDFFRDFSCCHAEPRVPFLA